MTEAKPKQAAPTLTLDDLRERAESIRGRRDLLEGYL
jgi:hypothetical protein